MKITTDDFKKINNFKAKAKEFFKKNEKVILIGTGYLLGDFISGAVDTIWLKRSLPGYFEEAQMEGAVGLYRWAKENVPGFEDTIKKAAENKEAYFVECSAKELTALFMKGHK